VVWVVWRSVVQCLYVRQRTGQLLFNQASKQRCLRRVDPDRAAPHARGASLPWVRVSLGVTRAGRAVEAEC
jgi:hypothetical protein